MLESKRRWHLGAEGEMVLCNNENAIKLNKTNPSKIACLTRIKSILCFETPKVSNATGLILVQPLRKVSLGSTFYPCAAAVPRLSFWGSYLSLVSNGKADLQLTRSVTALQAQVVHGFIHEQNTIFLRVSRMWMFNLLLNLSKLHCFRTQYRIFCMYVFFSSQKH